MTTNRTDIASCCHHGAEPTYDETADLHTKIVGIVGEQREKNTIISTRNEVAPLHRLKIILPNTQKIKQLGINEWYSWGGKQKLS